jgi:DNA-binding MarR family transcriptional regulator
LATQAAEIAAALDQIRQALRASLVEQARRMSGPAAELSTRMGLSHSTVSGIVDRLEARGFLRRAPREDDRRSWRSH